jgi:glutamate-1-semialdehyde 2,1-aminomutase
VFDEVITGFRVGSGGAQAMCGVTPDLTTFGKVIGGGLPIGAVGGPRRIMETLSPLGPVFHAGTLAGNPLATAAGLAALNELTDDVYAELTRRAARLASMMGEACAGEGFAAQFPVVGSLFGMYCAGDDPPVDFAGAKRTDEAAYARFFHGMLAEGVAMAPGAYEALFVGLAHTDDVLEQIAEAAQRAAKAAVSAG